VHCARSKHVFSADILRERNKPVDSSTQQCDRGWCGISAGATVSLVERPTAIRLQTAPAGSAPTRSRESAHSCDLA
jgi:hypothetical protein